MCCLNIAEMVYRIFPQLSQPICLIAKIHKHLLPPHHLVKIHVTFRFASQGERGVNIQSAGLKSMRVSC